MPQTMTARQAAALWEVSYAQARRILSPVTPIGRDMTTGAMLYAVDDVESARQAMPGQGARTDLTGKAE